MKITDDHAMKINDWERYVSADGEGICLGIKIYGYESRSATNLSDANWLRAKVYFDAHAGECVVQTELSIITSDLARFHDQIQQMLDDCQGEAVFDTLEEVLRIRVVLNDNGKTRISGAINGPEYKYAVNFNFESDQTFAKITLEELKQARHEFPIIEKL